MLLLSRNATLQSASFVPARWFTTTTGRQINVLVVHRMEAPDKPETAEGTAGFFQRLPSSDKASAHRCYDSDSVVECVHELDVAYHAPGANSDGWGAEFAGYSKDADWDHPTIQAMLQLGAVDFAAQATKWSIPIRWRTAADLVAGGDRRRGITSHAEVTKAYPNLGNHWDPGPAFQADAFVAMVAAAAEKLTGQPAPPAAPDLYVYQPGDDDYMPNLIHNARVGWVPAAACGVPNMPAAAGYAVQADGGVLALGGAPFYGSYPGLSATNRQGERYFIGIAPRNDGKPGYTCFSNDSPNGFSFGPDLNGWPAWPQP